LPLWWYNRVKVPVDVDSLTIPLSIQELRNKTSDRAIAVGLTTSDFNILVFAAISPHRQRNQRYYFLVSGHISSQIALYFAPLIVFNQSFNGLTLQR